MAKTSVRALDELYAWFHNSLDELYAWFHNYVCSWNASTSSPTPTKRVLFEFVLNDLVYSHVELHPLASRGDVWKALVSVYEVVKDEPAVHYVQMTFGARVRVPLALLVKWYGELFRDEYSPESPTSPIKPSTKVVPWAAYIFRALQLVVDFHSSHLEACKPETLDEIRGSVWEKVFRRYATRRVTGWANMLPPGHVRHGLVVVPHDPLYTTMSEDTFNTLSAGDVADDSEDDDGEAEEESEEESQEQSENDDGEAEKQSEERRDDTAPSVDAELRIGPDGGHAQMEALFSVMRMHNDLLGRLQRAISPNEKDARAKLIEKWKQLLAPHGVNVTDLDLDAPEAGSASAEPDAKRRRSA